MAQLHSENEIIFKQHYHPSIKQKGKVIDIRPYFKVRLKEQERLYTVWAECWRR
jgi:hypothetical protein